jgi:hypothetical protein
VLQVGGTSEVQRQGGAALRPQVIAPQVQVFQLAKGCKVRHDQR